MTPEDARAQIRVSLNTGELSVLARKGPKPTLPYVSILRHEPPSPYYRMQGAS